MHDRIFCDTEQCLQRVQRGLCENGAGRQAVFATALGSTPDSGVATPMMRRQRGSCKRVAAVAQDDARSCHPLFVCPFFRDSCIAKLEKQPGRRTHHNLQRSRPLVEAGEIGEPPAYPHVAVLFLGHFLPPCLPSSCPSSLLTVLGFSVLHDCFLAPATSSRRFSLFPRLTTPTLFPRPLARTSLPRPPQPLSSSPVQVLQACYPRSTVAVLGIKIHRPKPSMDKERVSDLRAPRGDGVPISVHQPAKGRHGTRNEKRKENNRVRIPLVSFAQLKIYGFRHRFTPGRSHAPSNVKMVTGQQKKGQKKDFASRTTSVCTRAQHTHKSRNPRDAKRAFQMDAVDVYFARVASLQGKRKGGSQTTHNIHRSGPAPQRRERSTELRKIILRSIRVEKHLPTSLSLGF